MNCTRCNGLIHDFEDGLAPRCFQCGRSPETAPTKDELLAAGVEERGMDRRKEMEGRPGPQGAREYSPAQHYVPHQMGRR